MTRRRRDRTIEVCVPSRLGCERAAVDRARDVATQMGFPPERVEDIKTAVSEATLNAIEHGNGLDPSRTVQVVLAAGRDRLEVRVQDESPRPFTPSEMAAAMPDLETKLDGLSNTRGWGMPLIRSLVDEVEISTTDRGNLVRMVVCLVR